MTLPRRLIVPLLGMALLTLTLAACDSAGTNDVAEEHPDDIPEEIPAEAPEVLPPDAFDLNVALFSGSNPATQHAKAGNEEYAHFTNAALRVWPVSVAVSAFLIVPAAVTGAALHADPVENDGTWIWESTVDTTGQTIALRLEGTPDDEQVDWTMYVTVPDPPQGDPLDDFELYTAETTLDGSSGSWVLFYPFDGEQTEVLNAHFTVTDDDTREITFRVPDSLDEYGGQRVYYAVNGATRTFEWIQGEDDDAEVTTAIWDAETHAGSLIAPDYNGGEVACWDIDLVNVECSD